MRKLLTLAFILLTTLVHAQQSEVRKLGINPSGIAVSTGIQAKIVKSDKNEVVLEAENHYQINRVETKIEDGILIIRAKRNSNIQNSRNLKATVYINPNIHHIEISSAGSLEINVPLEVRTLDIALSSAGVLKTKHISTGKLSIDASSASKLAIGSIKVNELDIEASSATSVVLTGQTGIASIDASTNANVNAAKVDAKTVSADASTGAKISIHVSETLKAEASSGGTVNYTGHPKTTNFEKSSGGTIHNAN